MPDRTFNYCPHCGKKLPKTNDFKANFCSFCGYKLRNKSEYSHPNVQCTICHNYISHEHKNSIKCSYCGSQFHSNCVSSWLLKYNACPMCQNVFTFPNRSLIELKH